MSERTHVDLFTGLAGFSLAAKANGIRTIVQCECDPFLRAGLARAWPGVPCIPDIREFHWPLADPVWLLTAGVPCQPASRAGKQRGSSDDRWLWPEAVRVLSEVRPTWALFENPPGIEDVGLDGVLVDVESAGYEIGPIFDIPACAVNAPHRRARLWIVAHAGQFRGGQDEPGREANQRAADRRDCARNVADAEASGSGQSFWDSFQWVKCADAKLRRAPDDAFGLADGLPRKLLAGLGNSIVWQLAAEIIRAIVAADAVQGNECPRA